ncbi:hypothetical protein GGF46_001663 [Coemansia sp. RSA 552]|nr:hypothetical protein GGF46_001663 [Coemansia sp. RSA 552]
MGIGRVASGLHILFSVFVLWIIIAEWYLTGAPAIADRSSPEHATASGPAVAESSGVAAKSSGVAAKRSGVAAKSTGVELSSKSTARQRRQQGGEADAKVSAAGGIAQGNAGTVRRVPLGKVLFLIVHIGLFAMVLDFVYRPLIAPAEGLLVFRPGYVSHAAAKLHIRYPDGGQLELRYREVLPKANLLYHNTDTEELEPADSIPWESAGSFAPPTSETDFTMTTELLNLLPLTRYVVELHSRQPTLHAETVRLGSAEFKTAPTPGDPTKLRFGTGSCIKPNFPYRPTMSPDVYGFASMLDHSEHLDMIMFMGDFIYADVPLYFGGDTEDYRRLYRQVYAARSSRRLLRKVPMLHVYDDHEIKNNWHRQEQAPMGSAMTAYDEYNGRANPEPAVPGASYYNFTHGNVAFYAWDTRRYRTQWETASSNGPEHTMLGREQKQHFVQWLHDVNHTAAVKFVVSSVPVTTGWSNHDSSQDTWRGYPTERAEILNLTQYVPNLLFLSGDRHEMAAVELPSGNIEFSTSPVSQFTFPLVGMFKKDADGDHTIHYRRQGHVKYGIIDVDTETNPDIPRIIYSLYTTDVHDGQKSAWVYEAYGAPWH